MTAETFSVGDTQPHAIRVATVKRARDPRYALPRARSGTRRKRDQEARNRNQISQVTAQLLLDALWGEREKLSGINGGRTRTRTWDPLIKSRGKSG